MRIAKNLDATKSANKLLHGDFHHQNILFDEKGWWVAIDPQGVIADPVFEVGVSFYNGPELEKTQDKKTLFLKRAKIFSEILGCDISRVLGWGFVQCMISTAWSVEDGADDYGDVVEGAKVLATLCD